MPVPGQILGGKYRLERLVGSGGFASVWAARNVMLDRVVALKILSENYARMPGFLPRFLREAKLASRAIHKTIVAVEDIDQTNDGLVYLVMELLEGQTLADELKGGKSLSLDRTLEIIVPTLEGLAAAHERNIIHRDIKPANIFLTDEGTAGPRVRILDLGLAKDLVSDDELTTTDQMVGTPSYLAPEMFMGPQARRWAPTADVFACGMLSFRMLAGGLPFDRSVAGLPPIEQFLARADFYQTVGQMPGPAQYVPEIPEEIDAVVRQAVSLDPQSRYPDASAMLEDFNRATSGEYRLQAESRPSFGEVGQYAEIGDFSDLGYDEDDEDEFDDGQTRVDANPFGLEPSDRGLPDPFETEDSTTSLRPPARSTPPEGRDAMPQTAPPAGDFASRPSTEPTAQQSGGSPPPQSAPRSVPLTLRPSEQPSAGFPVVGLAHPRSEGSQERSSSASSGLAETPGDASQSSEGMGSSSQQGMMPQPGAAEESPPKRSRVWIFVILIILLFLFFFLASAGTVLLYYSDVFEQHSEMSEPPPASDDDHLGSTLDSSLCPKYGMVLEPREGDTEDIGAGGASSPLKHI